MVWALLAGLGMFLLGMTLLTDGLKSVAGKSLRTGLLRFTSTRLRAATTGAVATAILQSSSATTLATIGFVAAGVMSLSAALAVIIGANVGTTATAWLVAGVGLKFSVSAWAGGVLAVGAVWRLFGHGRAVVGEVIAGFGLIFLGIDAMQAGMAGVASSIDLTRVGGGWSGAILLILVGALATALVQSSSATMATVLAALATGVIDLHAGALLAVGANLGTTITAGIGALGRPVAARQAAAAHVMFNIGAMVPTLLLLPLLLGVAEAVSTRPAIQLATFHTTFNLLGAALFLPLVPWFARLVERIVPQRGPRMGRHLEGLTGDVPAAMAAALRSTLAEVAGEQVSLIRARMEHPRVSLRRLEGIDDVMRRVQDLIDRQGTTGLQDVLHVVDHLQDALQEHHLMVDASAVDASSAFVVRLRAALDHAQQWLQGPMEDGEGLVQELEEVRDLRKRLRQKIIETASKGSVDPTMAHLDALAWLDGQVRHLRRIIIHLGAPST